MPVVSVKNFSGVAPKVAPEKLGDSMAQTATNVRLLAGTLDAWNTSSTAKSGLTAGAVSTIYRFGQDLISDSQYWFHWTVDVDVVKGAVNNDQTERTYFTHPTLGPRVTNNSLALTSGTGDYPWNSYPLGVPAPTSTPTLLELVAGTGDDEVRVYCFTYVTADGEESQPSPPSLDITVLINNTTVRVSGLGTTPPSGYTNITAKRVYRSLYGGLATSFQLVDEIPISQATYDDAIPGEELNETIPSTTWAPPPATAFGITSMANGIVLLFDGYDVYASEAYQPYAFPIEYMKSVDYPIVGGKAIGTSAVICTTGFPYLLTGSDPSAMSLVKLDAPQACVSKRSICAIDGGVVYASPDGLILVSSTGGVTNITQALFSRQEWQALLPSTMSGYYHDGRYYGFYGGATPGGFIIDPTQGAAAFTFIDTYATAGFSDKLQDALFLKVGTNIVKWDAGGAKQTYTWKSKVFERTTPSNPACAQVTAASYPVTFKLYADKSLKHTQTVTSADPFWLPSGYRCRYLEFQVEGSAEVFGVKIGDSPQELKAD